MNCGTKTKQFGKFGIKLISVSIFIKIKKVIVTGHTGFKGSWLTAMLIKLGAEVVGISKDLPTSPSMFEELALKNQIKHYNEDIRDLSKMIQIISDEKPNNFISLSCTTHSFNFIC